MNTVLFLGLILILGLISTRLTTKIKLPNVTAFLITGLLIAVTCLLLENFLDIPDQLLKNQLADLNEYISPIALGFIAISIGEEFKIKTIKNYGKDIIKITFFQALLAMVLVDIGLIILCLIFKINLSIALCLGAIATATAPAATIMVIHQYKAEGDLVDILLPVVAFDDAIGLIVFSLSVSISKIFLTDTQIAIAPIILIPLLEIVGSLVIGGILGFLMHIIIKFFKSRNNHMIIMIAFTLFGVGIIQVLNKLKLNGNYLEFSNLLTCMMIGAVYVNLANDEQNKIITRDIELMDRWTPFLFTLFFVLSGSHLVTSAVDIFSLDKSLFVTMFIIFFFYILLRSLGKYFGAYFGAKISNQNSTIVKYLGLTLLPQAGVAIGMANTISDLEIFNKNSIGNIIVTVVLLATLIYELIGPLITKWALKKAGNIKE